MATKGYQKRVKKHFINSLYRKLGCLVALVATLRGQTGQCRRREEEEESAPGSLTERAAAGRFNSGPARFYGGVHE